jgi:hypothetical protein
MANGITQYYPQPKIVQLIFGQSLRQFSTSLPTLIHPVIKKSTPNILPIFKSLPRTKYSFFKNAKKGLLNAVFVFLNHSHFRDNANGVNQTCHMGCPLSVASVQHH